MGTRTGIEWTDTTWNPTTGCRKVSPGCDNCYAATLAKRLKAMGNPRYQNDGPDGPGFGLSLHHDKLAGDRLYSVRDEGYSIEQDYGATGVRYSKTSEGFHFHTDSAPALAGITPAIIGLIALQTAKSGGASVLVSAKSVHDVMLAERPDLLALLYEPFHHDRSSELPPGESPTLLAPIFRFDGQLRMRYMRFYIERGHRKATAPLSSGQIEALDFLDSVMDREALHILFHLNRGEMLFVSNEFVLHSRTAFEDHAEPARRRHYARLWLGRETPIGPAVTA